jgi:prophage antirepressor-like protein
MQLNTFTFTDKAVRVFLDDSGEPWFQASDVCDILEIQNPRDAITRLDEEDKSTVDSTDGGPARNFINESGLYTLVLGSRKTEAKSFKKWVTSEVLPSIRKTGHYGVQKVPQNFAEALRLAADLEEQKQRLECKMQEKDAYIEKIVPRAKALHRIATATEGSFTLTECAKNVQMSPSDLIEHLCVENWLYRRGKSKRLLAFQDKIDRGYLEHKVQEIEIDDGKLKTVTQVMVTAKGVAKLALLFEEGD